MNLVSIVVPCYNPGAYLLDAIASARQQTHPDIEIIVVDDGSDQLESREILAQARQKADLYIEQSNRGLPSARNAGFRAARGASVVPLDQDDLIQPDYVTECLAALASTPEAAFAYTACRVFGTRNHFDPLEEYNLYRLLDRNVLTYAALIRKSDWQQAGGYDESMRHGYEDWEFWLRLGSRGRFGRYLPHPLFKYRKHGPTLYDVALSRHAEITAYIQSQHPELYQHQARAQIKKRWSPAVCIISSAPAAPQTIQDVQIEESSDQKPIVERSPAPAFLLCKQAGIDPHSAELAALAVWGGHKELQLPDGSAVLSRRAAEMWRANDQAKPSRTKVAQSRILPLSGELRRHLVNAELLSWDAWLRNPLRSAGRLVPLRFKERINRATGRPLFDLSFYLQFQPGSLLAGNSVVEPLQYFPNSPDGRLRVALITPHLGPGGAENVLLDIAATLCRERFEVLLLATQSRDDRWSSRWRNHAEHVYDLAQLVPPERMSAAIFSIVSNWRCDAALVQNSLYGYAALPIIKREFPGMKIMDLVHAFDDNWDQISVTAEVAAHIDVRGAVSSAVQQRLLGTGIPPERIRLIRSGVDLTNFHPLPMRREAATAQILFAGRLDPVKRPLLLVEIAERLSAIRKRRDFRFLVAGDGPEADSLLKSVRRAGLDEEFQLLGHVDDMASLFRTCDLCVMPSRAEGIPLVLLEALASSVPVVASNVGAIHEVLDSTCGVLVDTGADEPGAFAGALTHLLDEPELRRRLGAAGRRKMESEYDCRVTQEAYLSLFEKVGQADSLPSCS